MIRNSPRSLVRPRKAMTETGSEEVNVIVPKSGALPLNGV